MPAWMLLTATLAASAERPPSRANLLIDRSAEAYTVFTTIPADAMPRVGARLRGRVGVELAADADLDASVAAEWRRQVRRDDYAASGLRGRLPALLRELPGAPLGLTWNGGIAVTYGDCRHAEREFARWRAAPQDYAPPARDPLDPAHQLGR
ncbi:MAG TPA: hypothetical protein VLF18_02215 [Tahibacter sp.]|uniref:hypothetical protein n=1 Tax=Tahibacter sp. TaxID=2056211 RepID=UPI002BD61366|nr:hypothetical protein [Tahibacter sp.]HSX58991.1 hypothetical protein [Tahibacter sp.]